jgi:hypothetical protein
MDTVPDPLLLSKFGGAGNRTWAPGSVARNSGHTGCILLNLILILFNEDVFQILEFHHITQIDNM